MTKKKKEWKRRRTTAEGSERGRVEQSDMNPNMFIRLLISFVFRSYFIILDDVRYISYNSHVQIWY